MKNKRLLVHLHLYYHEQLDYMISKLKNITGCDWDLYVTVCKHNSKSEEKLYKFKPDTHIVEVENRGYDVWPFIQILRMVNLNDYDYVLKLHTKAKYGVIYKSYEWRNRLIEPLLDTSKQFGNNLKVLEERPDVGMLASKFCLYNYTGDVPEESWMLNAMMKRLGLHYKCGQYISGTVFMSRISVFTKIIQSDISEKDFIPFQRTGASSTNAHVLERIFSLIVGFYGLKILPVKTFKLSLKHWLAKMFSIELIKTQKEIILAIHMLKRKCIFRSRHAIPDVAGVIPYKYSTKIRSAYNKRVVIFAAYCPDGRISDAQLYYLHGLQKVSCNIILVADSLILPQEVEKIKNMVSYCEFAKHCGYDFLSYKKGFGYFIKSDFFENTEELIFCNDSCYGPVYSLSETFDVMSRNKSDFWGLVTNENPAKKQSKHLQSFFLVFKANVFKSKIFKNFIMNIKKQRKIKNVINKYEIPMTKYLQKHGFTYSSFIPENIATEQNINKTFYPLTLLKKYRMPVVKVKVFNNKFLSSIKEDSFDTLDYIGTVNPELAQIIREENCM